MYQVLDDIERPEHGPSDPAGQADDAAGAVAERGDAVQGARDAGPVVVAERADAFHHKGDGFGIDRLGSQIGGLGDIARLRWTAQVEDDFQ